MATDFENFLQSKGFDLRWSMLERVTQARLVSFGRLALVCSVMAAALLTHVDAKRERKEKVSAAAEQLKESRKRLTELEFAKQKSETAFAKASSEVVVTRVKLEVLEAQMRIEDRARDTREDRRAQLDSQIKAAEVERDQAQQAYDQAHKAYKDYRDDFRKYDKGASDVPGIEPYESRDRQAKGVLARKTQTLQVLEEKRSATYDANRVLSAESAEYQKLIRQLEAHVEAEISTKSSYEQTAKQTAEAREHLLRDDAKVASTKAATQVPDSFALPLVGASVPVAWFLGLGSALILFVYGEATFRGHAQASRARTLMKHAAALGYETDLRNLLPIWYWLSEGTRRQRLLSLALDLLALCGTLAVVSLVNIGYYQWIWVSALTAVLMFGTRAWIAITR